MTRVKICGITRLEDALAALDYGAGALGFNFYARSPRYVSVKQASRIIDRLPPFVTKIGVVVNWGTAQQIRRLMDLLGLDGIQLHGDESVALAKALKARTVIKAFRVGPAFSVSDLKAYPATAILLDGFAVGKYGGAGAIFDWRIAKSAARYHRIILSGGLTSANVGAAIRLARPYAVDVASGVEFSPGKKDHGRMRRFLAEVEKADQGLGK